MAKKTKHKPGRQSKQPRQSLPQSPDFGSTDSGSVFAPDEPASDLPSSVLPRHESRNLKNFGYIETNEPTIKLPIPQWEIDKTKILRPRDTQPYAKICKTDGYTALVAAAHEESERAGHAFFTGTQRYDKLTDWYQACVFILAGMSRKVLQCVLDGTLSQNLLSRHPDPELLRFYPRTSNPDRMSDWARRANKVTEIVPSIYMRELVDKEGRAPTAAQLRQVIEAIRQYVSGDRQYASQNARIDCQTRGKSDEDTINEGRHFHLKGSKERVINALTFANALEARLNNDAPVGTSFAQQPIDIPLRYFGYSAKSANRQKEHDKGSTNFLSALVNGITRYLFSDDNGIPTFQFRAYTIALLASREECKLGEELFTRCGGGYYYNGTGFNIADAGLSCSSSDLGDQLHKIATAKWEECQNFREDEAFNENMEIEIPMSEKFRDPEGRKKKLEEETAQLKARLVEEEAKREKLLANLEKTFEDQKKKLEHVQELIGNKRSIISLQENLERDMKKLRDLKD